jgi:hypothetical protein
VGTQHNARVRARTFLGAGPFTSKPTMKVVTSEPAPPILRFVGSGGVSVPFLRVFLDPPEDFGDGNFTGGSRNTSVVLISYQFSISPAQNFGTSYNVSVRVNNLVNQKALFDYVIAANSSIMLKYGIRYFIRAKVENAVGFSAWSNSASCTLVKRPGVVCET